MSIKTFSIKLACMSAHSQLYCKKLSMYIAKANQSAHIHNYIVRHISLGIMFATHTSVELRVSPHAYHQGCTFPISGPHFSHIYFTRLQVMQGAINFTFLYAIGVFVQHITIFCHICNVLSSLVCMCGNSHLMAVFNYYWLLAMYRIVPAIVE